MADAVKLRSGLDRLRYAAMFEASLLAMMIPAGSLVFDKPAEEIGLLGLVLCSKALALSVVYNRAFDRIDARAGRVASERSALGRIVHAVGFEAFLTLTSLPLYVFWMGFGIGEALAADVVWTGIVVAWTYVYTLAYDRAFPVGGAPVRAGGAGAGRA